MGPHALDHVPLVATASAMGGTAGALWHYRGAHRALWCQAQVAYFFRCRSCARFFLRKSPVEKRPSKMLWHARYTKKKST